MLERPAPLAAAYVLAVNQETMFWVAPALATEHGGCPRRENGLLSTSYMLAGMAGSVGDSARASEKPCLRSVLGNLGVLGVPYPPLISVPQGFVGTC